MPDQVRHDGFGTFYEAIKNEMGSNRYIEEEKYAESIDYQRVLGVFEVQKALLAASHRPCARLLGRADRFHGNQCCGTIHLCPVLGYRFRVQRFNGSRLRGGAWGFVVCDR